MDSERTMISQILIDDCEKKLAAKFAELDGTALFNQEKVLTAFKKNRVALRHFNGSFGYGYDDEGRDTLNSLLKDIFNCESAVVSPLITSGTHALSLCLYGVLRPGDKVLSITGEPYDTLRDVIYGENNGSLKDFGVSFDTVKLKDGNIDEDAMKALAPLSSYKMVYMQRSRGYEWREALTVEKIGKAVEFVRSLGFNGCIMLDNCYGEFVEKKEPTEVGVDLLAGSLIKNLGGGIAPTGGYFAGKKKYVDMVNARLTAPSIAGEVGSYAFGYRDFYEGIFIAPHTVKEALKGSLLFGEVLSYLGYETSPKANERQGDLIRAVKFNDKDKLISFIRCIQEFSPVDSFVTATPWAMPGYNDEVIMAAGCFTQGSSIELSADAPIRPPYIAYIQGGLTYEHCKTVIKNLSF
ncbi:MAG: methionine gamma-lyase family protein [Clostridia bacterium]|nr:methionine gamma-lyase family protein [Clostridia bacterium]